MDETIEVEAFYRDGVAMIRLPDGGEMRLADAMRQAYPDMQFDDTTGLAVNAPAQPDPTSPASMEAVSRANIAAMDQGEAPPKRGYQFGDIGDEMGDENLALAKDIFLNTGSVTRNAVPESVKPYISPLTSSVPDLAMAGLLGAAGLGEKALGYGAEAVDAGVRNAVEGLGFDWPYAPGTSARKLAGDVIGGLDVSGVGPEARIMGAIAEAARPAARAAVRGVMDDVVDRLNQPGQMPTTFSNPIPGLLGGSEQRNALEDVLRAKYPGVKLSLTGDASKGYKLNQIIVPEEQRGSGVGSAIMRDIADAADQQGATVSLSPSADFGGSVGRLKEFYSRFGFVPNKGKSKDFAISESMYRLPKSDFPGLLPSAVSAPADEVAVRGAEIVDLLRSGRADEVTDAMFDMGDPVLNTRLNEYLWNNYDLPMDAASRMERASNWPTPLDKDTSHGTPYADIVEFRPSEFGSVGPGVYVAGRPVTSSDYAKGYGLMRPKDTFIQDGETYTIGGNVMPLRTPSNLQSFKDWSEAKMADMQRQGLHFSSFKADENAMRAAQDAGFSGVAGRNENNVVFDPRNIRSRFARFDPRLAHLKNLNAGVAGAAIGGGAYALGYPDEAQASEPGLLYFLGGR